MIWMKQMTYRVNQSAIVLFIALILGALSSCSRDEPEQRSTMPPAPETIAATNKIRREHGIREVKEGWSFYLRWAGAESWKDSRGHVCKEVCYNTTYHEIRSEWDSYYSGRSFSCADRDGGLIQEMLRISYFYAARTFGLAVTTDNEAIQSMVKQLGSEISYPTKYGSYVGLGFMGKTNEDTLEVADKILKMWGLERL